MWSKLSTYYHTLRHLKPIQLQSRLSNLLKAKLGMERLPKPGETPVMPQLQLQASIPQAHSWNWGPNLGSNETFTFLNLSHAFLGSDIDWGFAAYGKLWTYNLNYFDYLNQAGLNTDEGLRIIYDFIQKQDRVKDGLEPFPISLRGINWVKFLVYHDLDDESIRLSLLQQYKLLQQKLEYHLLGNHLLENGFSLLFGAVYFQDESLYKSAKKILVPELEEQVLVDGAHFELSPMYHQAMLFRVLDCYNLLANNDSKANELRPLFQEKAEKMLGWLEAVTFSNGDIPLVNDSAFGIAPTTSDLSAYGKRLGLKPSQCPLGDSGYRMIRTPQYELFLDIGHIGPDYIPGHAHSDTLNFVLYINGEPFIVDTGTSTYEKNARRQLERSTSSHNTVMIANQEQSEVWGGFRVARRAYPTIHEEGQNLIVASHDGYDRIAGKHTRAYNWTGIQIVIKDEVKTKSQQSIKAFLHFHPDIEVKLDSGKVLAGNAEITFEGVSHMQLEEYLYAPEFNQQIPATKAVIEFTGELNTTIQL